MSRLALATALLVAVAAPVWAAPGDCPALPPRAPMPAEAVPGMTDIAYWRDQVALLEPKLAGLQLGTRRLVFVGDSITAGWDPTLFSQFYGARAPLLLGVGGMARRACCPGSRGNGDLCTPSWSCC